MKIKVVKSCDPKCWYNDKIGSIFEVFDGFPKPRYYRIGGGAFLKDDCEIVEDAYGKRSEHNNGSAE